MKRLLKITSILLLSIMPTFGVFAQEEPVAQVVEKPGFFEQEFDVMMPVLILAVFLLIVLVLLLALTIDYGRFYRKTLMNAGKAVPGVLKLFGIFDGDWRAMTGENKDEIHAEEHDYDGIQEYDNDLPPWWVAGFYVTIIFAVVYLFAFEVMGWGPTQEEEYQKEIAMAEIKYANVDLVYEGPTADEAALAEAQELFVKNCKACHKEDGRGEVGPNLTDEFWKHGGSINDMYHTIKYGVVEQGMKAWKNDFSNEQIYNLASYITTLDYVAEKDGGKAPEGDKYVPEAE